MKFPCDVIIHCEPNKKGTVVTMTGWNELVRCKDCKYYYEKEWVVGKGSYTTCWYQTIANAHPNDFCSRAERKEE